MSKLYVYCASDVNPDAAPYSYDFTKSGSVSSHISKLCKHFSLRSPVEHYALQVDSTKKYLTDADIRGGVKSQTSGSNDRIVLVKSPKQQALEMIEKLRTGTSKKAAVFFLSKQLSDIQFLQHFLQEDGVAAVVSICTTESGSTLSYALNALWVALTNGVGWDLMSDELVETLLATVDKSNPINVVTNTLKVLCKLVSEQDKVGFGALHAAMFEVAHRSGGGVKPWASLMSLLEDDSPLQLKVHSLDFIVESLKAAGAEGQETQHEFLALIQQLGLADLLRPHVVALASPDFQMALYKLQQARFDLLHAESKEMYDKENPIHEAVLMALWHTVNPNVKLQSRVSDQWKELGFQGADPATDFRGMGLIGLKHLLYFAKVYTSTFKDMAHQQASRETKYYPTAVAGINISQMLFALLDIGKSSGASSVMGGAVSSTDVAGAASSSSSSIDATAMGELPGQVFPVIFDHDFGFEELYCLVFQLFHRVWDEMNADYMDFTNVSAAIKQRVSDTLKECPSLAAFRQLHGLPTLQPAELRLPASRLLSMPVLPGSKTAAIVQQQLPQHMPNNASAFSSPGRGRGGGGDGGRGGRRRSYMPRASAPVGAIKPSDVLLAGNASSGSSSAAAAAGGAASSSAASDGATKQALLSGTMPLCVYIVPASVTKTLNFDRNASIKQCLEVIERTAKKKMKKKSRKDKYGMFLPSGAVWFDDQRKLWSFMLAPNDRIEYKKRPPPETEKIVIIEISAGGSSFTQRIAFMSQTSVHGILQAIDKGQNVLPEIDSYGIFMKGKDSSRGDIWLDSSRPLSSYGVKHEDTLEFKKREVGGADAAPAPRKVILTIMFPDTTSKFVMPFDAANTGADVMNRVSRRVSLTDYNKYGLFHPKTGQWLGESQPLSLLGQLEMKDVIEFKVRPDGISASGTVLDEANVPAASDASAPPPALAAAAAAGGPISPRASPSADPGGGGLTSPTPPRGGVGMGGMGMGGGFAALAAQAVQQRSNLASGDAGSPGGRGGGPGGRGGGAASVRASCPVGTFQPMRGGGVGRGGMMNRTPSGRFQRLGAPPIRGSGGSNRGESPQRTVSEQSMRQNAQMQRSTSDHMRGRGGGGMRGMRGGGGRGGGPMRGGRGRGRGRGMPVAPPPLGATQPSPRRQLPDTANGQPLQQPQQSPRRLPALSQPPASPRQLPTPTPTPKASPRTATAPPTPTPAPTPAPTPTPKPAAAAGAAPAPTADAVGKPINEWDVDDVVAWVKSIGLEKYAGTFKNNMIDGETILELSTAELRDELEISALGVRKELLRQIRAQKDIFGL
jgi:ELMO/CED-12 family/SAM domain (Sterile alpha motif)/N-terminal or F0 domain of Talin-head FERM/ELMO, armadillo-like helical domain